MESKIVHIELPALDFEKAKKFYETVFGWEVIILTGFTDYAFFKTGETGIGGAFTKAKRPASGEIMLYIQVEDIPTALRQITKNHGSVLQEKTAIGQDMGYYAIFKDINGNKMGLWSQA